MVRRQSGNPFFGIVILMVLLIMLWLAVSAVKGIFTLLSWFALPLFIFAMIMNYTVVVDYFKWLWKMLREDTIKGIIYTGLSALAYPLVSAYLALKAFNNNRWTNPKAEGKTKQGEYIGYEEVPEDEDFLELPEIESLKETKDSNKYDDMF